MAMDSTGLYLEADLDILEQPFDITLVNAQHFRSVPGGRRDLKDGEWLGEVIQYELVRTFSSASVVDRPCQTNEG